MLHAASAACLIQGLLEVDCNQHMPVTVVYAQQAYLHRICPVANAE